MKKIPTAFVREFENGKIVSIKNEFTNDICREAVKYGTPTLKLDGACCAIIGGELYKRYDCKKGKTPPMGAIPCCEPDIITGHYPHWVKVSDTPVDKWFRHAEKNVYTLQNDLYLNDLDDGTYEAIGPHFQGNPYNLPVDMIVKHGIYPLFLPIRNFGAIHDYLRQHYIEGIVFWIDGEPVCKIKRSDFCLEWGN